MESITIQISKTSDGLRDYMQITSPDQTSINIVLVVGKIVVDDRRETETTRSKTPRRGTK